ncbi:hypothetical protein [Extensimonas sp. H3M7-6]|uniref:hypothetical protein n=1 Tax=Extensimonas soli TaxID=3031322 RepID=UPI0023DAC2FB|nr:hypothetical protein [Extensimonas sp. H3M7-6]MDF1481106.1 hypothetical protein [Extensimonas sp. H3M7-6]
MTISAQNLAQRYIDALTEIGVAAKRDDDNDVVFKILGTGSFYLSLDAEKDPEFMRLVFPNFYESKDALPVLKAINTVNMENKAVKLWARERDGKFHVSASIESFLASPDQAPDPGLLKAILERCLSATRAGVESFAEEIEKSDASKPEDGASI